MGDNFSFDAVLENEWNLATSLRVDDLTAESLKATDEFSRENDVAFEISKLADGVFSDKISVLNADIGNEMSDDNLDHQKSIETLLLDQRRLSVPYPLMKKFPILCNFNALP